MLLTAVCKGEHYFQHLGSQEDVLHKYGRIRVQCGCSDSLRSMSLFCRCYCVLLASRREVTKCMHVTALRPISWSAAACLSEVF